LPRLTAVENAVRTKSPEILDDGGTIARRIIGIADRDADMGAMLLRHTLWKLREDVGDGTATAAVMFQAIFDEGRRYIAAGGNVMGLKARLERGMRLVYEALADMATPLEGEEAIARLAETICYDRPLAEMLGEIFDIIGEHGYLEIRSSNRPGLEREYMEGAYWEGGWLSRHMVTDQARLEAHLQDAALLITNLAISDVPALARVMEMVSQNGGRSLVVIAQSLSESALALLLLNRDQGNLSTLAVHAPKGAPGQMWGLEDIGVLTGGRFFIREAGETLDDVQWEDLGQARRVWATRDYFGMVGGRGEPDALRQHIAALREALPQVEDAGLRRQLQERIGRLMGGSAILHVGGATESEIKLRQELAERTASALRGAIRDGVVPGGGMAFLACRRLLSARSVSDEERAAFRILYRALEAPARAILHNAGYELSSILAQVEAAGPGYGFDVTTGQMVGMQEAGILDAVSVQQAALRAAVTAAALALSTDVLVHCAEPETSVEP
jgi:chaperonin GroEL